MIGPTNALTVTGTVDPGSVTVGSNLKPVKLVNGVATAVDNDLVSTTGDQTIAGVKTFTNNLQQQNTAYHYGTTPSAQRTISFQAKDDVGILYAGMDFVNQTNDVNAIDFNIRTKGSTGWLPIRFSFKRTPTEAYATFPYRTYTATNVNDVVTIGSLQDSTDVVHRSGEETIAGSKTFSNTVVLNGLFRPSSLTRSGFGSGATNEWREVATFSGNVRALILSSCNQSERLGLMQIRGGNNPKIEFILKKNYNVANFAINYDGTGNCILLVRTPYIYQQPQFFPIWVQKDDGASATAILWLNGGTTHGTGPTPTDLTYSEIVYSTFIGLDTA